MTWLITGASGLLGPYLVNAASGIYRCCTDKIDLEDEDKIRYAIRYFNPSVVIHAAAFTDVDGCESMPTKAFRINQGGTASLAQFLEPTTKLVYISTDMVYPDTPGPHKEEEVQRPANNYGLSKRLGEIAARKHHNTLVLRTNFFGPSLTSGRKSLSDWVVESKPDEVYGDKFSPLHMETLANLIVELVERGLTGVFNAGSREGCSKSLFASILLGNPVRLIERPPGGAPRPQDMRMDVSRLESRIGRCMPTLEAEMAKLPPKWFAS